MNRKASYFILLHNRRLHIPHPSLMESEYITQIAVLERELSVLSQYYLEDTVTAAKVDSKLVVILQAAKTLSTNIARQNNPKVSCREQSQIE